LSVDWQAFFVRSRSMRAIAPLSQARRVRAAHLPGLQKHRDLAYYRRE
jgi:hypothetical protein